MRFYENMFKIVQLLLQGHFELHVDWLSRVTVGCIGPDYTMNARSARVKTGAVASNPWKITTTHVNVYMHIYIYIYSYTV